MIIAEIKKNDESLVVLYANTFDELVNQIKLLYLPEKTNKNYHNGCQVCGIGANNIAMGYVCYRSDCPTRITC